VNLTHLKAFYMVAKNRSFTLACKELNVSQSTISLQVQELEKFCEIPLLIRNTKSVQLTHEGKLIFPFAEKIFSLAGEIENTIADIKNLNLGTLKIGTTPLTLKNFIPSIISSLKKRYPGLKVHLFVGTAKEILQRVIGFEYHIGIIGRLSYPNNIIHKQIQRMKLYFISKGRIEERIRLRNLANYPIICPLEGASLREIIINEFRSKNIPLNIQVESDDPAIIRSMVRQGLGGAFMPLCFLEEDLEGEKFEITEIQDSLYLYLDAIFLRERKKSHFIKSIITAIDHFKCSDFD
jgi:DNA-binding transcriptional LysR family regulator